MASFGKGMWNAGCLETAFSSCKGKPVLAVYKGLEHALTDPNKQYRDKVNALLSAWEHVCALLQNSTAEVKNSMIQWIVRHTLNVVLRKQWPGSSRATKTHLIVSLKRCSSLLTGSNAHMCHILSEMVNKPWAHPLLRKVMEESECITEEEALNFCKYETSCIVIMRLQILVEEGLSEYSTFKYAEFVAACLSFHDPSWAEDAPEEDTMFVHYTYLVLLLKFRKSDNLLDYIRIMNLNEGLKFMKSLTRIKSIVPCSEWPGLCKNVAKFAAKYFLSLALRTPECENMLLKDVASEFVLCCEMDFQFVCDHMRLMPHLAATVTHMYILCEVLEEKFGAIAKSFCVQGFIRRLFSEIGTIEELQTTRQEEGDSQEKRDLLSDLQCMLSDGYLKLGHLLRENLNVYKECVLTAFSLNPTEDLYHHLHSLASLSGKCISDENKSTEIVEQPPVQDCTITKLPINEHLEETNESNYAGNTDFAYMNMPSTSSAVFPKYQIRPQTRHTASRGDIPIATSSLVTVRCRLKEDNKRDLGALYAMSGNLFTSAENYDPYSAPNHVLDAGEFKFSRTVLHDLVSVLNNPRNKQLSWAEGWAQLSRNCLEYLRNRETRNCMKELKFLEIDYEKYRDWPRLCDYGGIEKGYEQWADISNDSEQLCITSNYKHRSSELTVDSCIDSATQDSVDTVFTLKPVRKRKVKKPGKSPQKGKRGRKSTNVTHSSVKSIVSQGPITGFSDCTQDSQIEENNERKIAAKICKDKCIRKFTYRRKRCKTVEKISTLETDWPQQTEVRGSLKKTVNKKFTRKSSKCLKRVKSLEHASPIETDCTSDEVTSVGPDIWKRGNNNLDKNMYMKNPELSLLEVDEVPNIQASTSVKSYKKKYVKKSRKSRKHWKNLVETDCSHYSDIDENSVSKVATKRPKRKCVRTLKKSTKRLKNMEEDSVLETDCTSDEVTHLNYQPDVYVSEGENVSERSIHVQNFEDISIGSNGAQNSRYEIRTAEDSAGNVLDRGPSEYWSAFNKIPEMDAGCTQGSEGGQRPGVVTATQTIQREKIAKSTKQRKDFEKDSVLYSTWGHNTQAEEDIVRKTQTKAQKRKSDKSDVCTKTVEEKILVNSGCRVGSYVDGNLEGVQGSKICESHKSVRTSGKSIADIKDFQGNSLLFSNYTQKSVAEATTVGEIAANTCKRKYLGKVEQQTMGVKNFDVKLLSDNQTEERNLVGTTSKTHHRKYAKKTEKRAEPVMDFEEKAVLDFGGVAEPSLEGSAFFAYDSDTQDEKSAANVFNMECDVLRKKEGIVRGLKKKKLPPEKITEVSAFSSAVHHRNNDDVGPPISSVCETDFSSLGKQVNPLSPSVGQLNPEPSSGILFHPDLNTQSFIPPFKKASEPEVLQSLRKFRPKSTNRSLEESIFSPNMIGDGTRMLFREGKIYYTEFAPMLSTLNLNPHVVLEDIATVLNSRECGGPFDTSQQTKNSNVFSEKNSSSSKKSHSTKFTTPPQSKKTYSSCTGLKKKPNRKLTDREILANSVPGLNSLEMIVPPFQEPTVQVVQLPRNHPSGNASNNETSSLPTKVNQKIENSSNTSGTSHIEAASTSVSQDPASQQSQVTINSEENRTSQNLPSSFSAQSNSLASHNEKQRSSQLEVKYLTKASDVNEILRSTLTDCSSQSPPTSAVAPSLNSSGPVKHKVKSQSEVKYLTTTSEVNEVLRSVIAENSQGPMSNSTHIMGLVKQKPNTRAEARLLAAYETARSITAKKATEGSTSLGGRGSILSTLQVPPSKGVVDINMLSSLISSGTHRYLENYPSKRESSKPPTKLNSRSQASRVCVSSCDSSRAHNLQNPMQNSAIIRSAHTAQSDEQIPERMSVLEERLKKSSVASVAVKCDTTNQSETPVCASQVATLPKFQQAFGKSIYNQTGSSGSGAGGGGSNSNSSTSSNSNNNNSNSSSKNNNNNNNNSSSGGGGSDGNGGGGGGTGNGNSGSTGSNNGGRGHCSSSSSSNNNKNNNGSSSSSSNNCSSSGSTNSSSSRCNGSGTNNSAVENGASEPATTVSNTEDVHSTHGIAGGSQKSDSELQSIPKSSVSTLHSKAVQTTSISTLVSLSNPVSSALQADSLNVLMTTALHLNTASVPHEGSLQKSLATTFKRATRSSVQAGQCPSYDMHRTNASAVTDNPISGSLDGISSHTSDSNNVTHKNSLPVSRSSQVPTTTDSTSAPTQNPVVAVTKDSIIRSNKNALLAAALQSTTPLRRSSVNSGTSSSLTSNIEQAANMCIAESSSSEDEATDVGTQTHISSVQQTQRLSVNELRKTTSKPLLQTSHNLRPVLHIPNSTLVGAANVTELTNSVSSPLRQQQIVHSLLGPSSSAVTRLPPQNVAATDALISHSAIEPSVSSTTLEQLREFESVLEQVTNTSQMKERSTAVTQNQPDLINEDLLSQSSSTVETSSDFPSAPNDGSFSQDSYPSTTITTPPRVGITFVAQSPLRSSAGTSGKIASPVVVVTSYCQPVTSPALSVTSQSSSSPCVTPAPNPSISNGKPPPKSSKSKTKSVKSSPSTTNSKSSPVPKPQQKPQEDEVTAQRIYAILDEYAEQLRNSPDLNNKPAPRRRSNPPTNPSQSSKRKKSSQNKSKLLGQQSSSSAPDMSPGTDDPRTMGSEDSSSGIMQLSHIQDSPASSAQASDEPASLRSTSTEASSESCKPVVSESGENQDSRQQPRLIFAEATGRQGRAVSVQDDIQSAEVAVSGSATVVAGKSVMVGSTAVPLYVPGNVRQVFLPVTPGLAAHVQGRPMVVSKGSKFIRVHQVTVPAGPLHLHQVPVVVRQMCVNKQSSTVGASVSVLTQPSVKQVKRPPANTSPEALSGGLAQASVLHQLSSQQQTSVSDVSSSATQSLSFPESSLDSVGTAIADTVIKTEPNDDTSSVSEGHIMCEGSQNSLLETITSAANDATALTSPATTSSGVIATTTSSGPGVNISSVISAPEDKLYQSSEHSTVNVKVEPPDLSNNSNEEQNEENQLCNNHEERSVFRRTYAIVINPPIDVQNSRVNRTMQRLNIGFTRHSTVTSRNGNQPEALNKDFASSRKPLKTEADSMLNSESESSEYHSDNALATQLNHFSKHSGSLTENGESGHSVNSVLNCPLPSTLPDSTYHLRKLGKSRESSQPAGGFQSSTQNTICTSPLDVFPTESATSILEDCPPRTIEENGCSDSLSSSEPSLTHTLLCRRNSQSPQKVSLQSEVGRKISSCDKNGPADIELNAAVEHIVSESSKSANDQTQGKEVGASSEAQLDYCSGPYSSIKSQLDYISDGPYSISKIDGCDTPWRFVPLIRKVKVAIQPVTLKKDTEESEPLVRNIHLSTNLPEVEDTANEQRDYLTDSKLATVNRKANVSSTVLTTFRKNDIPSTRVDKSQVSDRIQQKIARVERELKLQKSLSEECEDLGVDEPSTSDLFPEADLLLDTNSSPPFDQTLQDTACGHCVDGTETYSNSAFKPLEYSSSSQDDSQNSCISSDIHESNNRFRQGKKRKRSVNIPNFDWKYTERKTFCHDIVSKICQSSRETSSIYHSGNTIIKGTGSGIGSRSLEDTSGGFRDTLSDSAPSSRLKHSSPGTDAILPDVSTCNTKEVSDNLMKDAVCGKKLEGPLQQTHPSNSCMKSQTVTTVNSKGDMVASASDSTFCSSSEDSVTMLDTFSTSMIVSSLDVTIPSPLPTLPSVIQSNDNSQEPLPSATGTQKYSNTYSKRPSCEQGSSKLLKRARLNQSEQYYNEHIDSQERWESSSSQEKVCADDEDSGSRSRSEEQPNSDVDVLDISNDAFSSSPRFPSLNITNSTGSSSQCNESIIKTFELNGIDRISLSSASIQEKRISARKLADHSDSECHSLDIKNSRNVEHDHFCHKQSVIHINSSKTRASQRGHLKRGCPCCSLSSRSSKKKMEEKPGKKGPLGKQTIKGSLPKKR
ncbi:serine-rich adhesin for platelets-like [Schistocerca americana]|uniref:serine-rich adhesin for platelets-like n=1 Tax=Schistocerca americana TaxID=7009 RepID=UPI001F4F3749|nr:serine-rich adhesin for platelets-like [Schistocerca americana]